MRSGPTQAALLIAVSAVVAFAWNAMRDEPLPLTGSLDPPPPPEEGADLPADPPEVAVTEWEDGAIFLDVRPREEYDTARVSGALSFAAADFDRRYFEVVAPIGTAAPLFLYGAGPDSHVVRRVAAKLLAYEHTDVRLAACGLESLRSAGIDVASGPAEGMP